MMNEGLVQIREYWGEGYKPLVDYDTWRVAILRFIKELRPENLKYLECHLETDEVFVLLSGQCILFIGALENEGVSRIDSVVMEPMKLYNIRKGVYHSHILSQDATVLIVENRDTAADNSRRINLTDAQRAKIISLGKLNKKSKLPS